MPTVLGPLSVHMLQHILLMNALAPMLVHLFRPRVPADLWRIWPWATALQLLFIWGWHSPGLFSAAMSSLPMMVLMQGSLLGSAILFWSAMWTMPGSQRWRAIFALLITGKLFCLLGALLVFSPRILYGYAHQTMAHEAIDIADQQMAGLLMLIACPLTYILAGVVLSAQWFLDIERQQAPHGGQGG